MRWLKAMLRPEMPAQQSFPEKDTFRLPFSSFQTWFEQEQPSPAAASEITIVSQKVLHASKRLHSFQERIADHQQRREKAQELVQSKEQEWAQLLLDPHRQHLVELKQRRDQAQEKITQHRNTLDSAFTVLHQLLSRPENAVFHHALFSHYFFDSIKTLLADRELRIVLQLKAIQAALDAHQLVVPLRDLEAAHAALQTLEPVVITAIQQECLDLQQDLFFISQQVNRKDLLQTLDDLDYWLKHHQQQVVKLEQDIQDLEEEIQRVHEQRQELVHQLESLASEALQRNIVITI
ncbi:hypothetical protein HY495_03255 [Candidatus Woesearchaeota archaeon]|nr:hypothetical protein [Candidatus Woesearchaeota archaeon]